MSENHLPLQTRKLLDYVSSRPAHNFFHVSNPKRLTFTTPRCNRFQSKMSFISIVKPACAVATMAASLGSEGGKVLRTECAKTETFVVLLIAIGLVLTFWAFNFPTWARLLPVWLGAGYGILYVPIRTALDNSSEVAFMASGLTKTEWINTISADSRVRLTVFASLTAALIVSLNAWITRWENSNNQTNVALANAQKGVA